MSLEHCFFFVGDFVDFETYQKPLNIHHNYLHSHISNIEMIRNVFYMLDVQLIGWNIVQVLSKCLRPKFKI